jgi:flagellar FliL protein
MAKDASDLENDLDEEKGGSKKLIIIIALVVLIAGGAGAFFLLGGDENKKSNDESSKKESVEIKEAIYVRVPNAITANLAGKRRSRTVQIKIAFLVRTKSEQENVKMHMPQLKNDVLMLVSQKKVEQLRLPDGRKQLQKEALETVQATLSQLVGEPTIERVLFVSFVMQ